MTESPEWRKAEERSGAKKERQSKKFCKELESHGEVAFKVAHRK